MSDFLNVILLVIFVFCFFSLSIRCSFVFLFLFRSGLPWWCFGSCISLLLVLRRLCSSSSDFLVSSLVFICILRFSFPWFVSVCASFYSFVSSQLSPPASFFLLLSSLAKARKKKRNPEKVEKKSA